MALPFLRAFEQNFLDHAPRWCKGTILAFLIINPCLLYTLGPFVTGWCLVLEFIVTLSMALKSYPLQPRQLLSLEAALIRMAKPETVYHDIQFMGFRNPLPVLPCPSKNELLSSGIHTTAFPHFSPNCVFVRNLRVRIRYRPLSAWIFLLNGKNDKPVQKMDLELRSAQGLT